MKIKIVALLIALLFIVSACGDGNQPATPGGDTGSTDTASTDTGAADDTEDDTEVPSGSNPDVIEFMIGEQYSAPVTNELRIIQELQTRTNTILNITNVAQTDLEVRSQTALASGDPPDVMAMFNYDNAAVQKKMIRIIN